MTFVVAVNSLEDLQRQARPYPTHLLPETGTALGLFAAGFWGWNDCVWFAQHGLQTTCVDVDKDKLFEMSQVYPDGWEFRVEDAWEFAERATHDGRTWDVVSVDPFMGDAAEKAADTLYLWTSLADRLVTLTASPHTRLNTPDGWRTSFFPRSSTVAWLVMVRD